MKYTIFALTLMIMANFLTGTPVNAEGELSSKEVAQKDTDTGQGTVKLYWFIPDGMRADPDLFNIFRWAKEGDLPNIRRMMEQGAYGFSVPTFPSHTPTNFATLLTGAYPRTHGVSDGPMHVEGRPLSTVSVGGFSSLAKKIDPIWTTLEEQNEKVFLLSVPGSTPPELEQGITVRGRWGGWGADFHALVFESKGDRSQRKKQGRGSRLFFFGPELTRYVDAKEAEGWAGAPKSYSTPLEVELSCWGTSVFAYIFDSTNDELENYDKIYFSIDKTRQGVELREAEQSDWIPITLNWQGKGIVSDVNVRIVKLDENGFIRIRLFFNNLNPYNVSPSLVAGTVRERVGPMVDFVDNFPPQLIYYDEDKQAFLDEMNMSFAWHTEMIPFLIKEYRPQIVIHDIYSPNQMLTSRWWLGYIDPESHRYNDVDDRVRKELWEDVRGMYRSLDAMVGKILDNTDDNTIVVLSSDHGAVPLNRWVRLNNYFSQKGWLRFKIDKDTGEPIVDWDDTKVIYLKMDGVYIHPDGLGGEWTRGSGEKYEKLRQEVMEALLTLDDPESRVKPVRAVVKWEDARQYLDLPEDRVGDLIIANKAGYGWNEEMTEDREIFSEPLKTGYKQAIYAKETKGLWAPFIIMGPGVRKNHEIPDPIEMVDQYPTIMTLLNKRYDPVLVEGRVLHEIIEKK